MANFEDLLGKKIVRVEGMYKDSEEIFFHTDDGSVYQMYHPQDCCEYVYLEDVVGDPQDLVNGVVLIAEESTKENPDEEYGAGMWTFYKIATFNGYINLRWYGSSNGYYGVGVAFRRVSGK